MKNYQDSRTEKSPLTKRQLPNQKVVPIPISAFGGGKKNVVYHELLPRNITITAVYCQQIHPVEAAIPERRLGRHHQVILQLI